MPLLTGPETAAHHDAVRQAHHLAFGRDEEARQGQFEFYDLHVGDARLNPGEPLSSLPPDEEVAGWYADWRAMEGEASW
jgi:hypothetical protein